MVFVILVGGALWRGGYRDDYTDALLPVVRQHAAGSSAYVFTTKVSRAFPLVTYAGASWSSRFSTLWLLPGLERARRAPAVIVVDVRGDKAYFGGLQFDYLAYFSKDPSFVEIWSHYKLLVNFGTYHVYKRRPGLH